MSVHYSGAAWKCRVPEMSIKLVLVKLADNANDQGEAWPSIETICRETCMSKSTVFRNMSWMERRGILRRDPGNSMRSTRYWLDKEAMELDHTVPLDEPSHRGIIAPQEAILP